MARGGSEAARASATNTRQTSGTGGLSQASEADVTAVVERVLKKRLGDVGTSLEKLQVLLGERGTDRAGQALTRGDMALNLAQFRRVSAAPTAADYNALVDALNDLLGALTGLAR